MKTVQTVLGDISTDQLGFTLMHEHLVSSATGIPENFSQLYPDNYYNLVLKDLLDMKGSGIHTVIDATAFDLGRDVRALKRLSEDSGLNIVATTGFFLEPNPMLGSYSADRFASLFIDELTKGIAGTGIKAGIIKTAMDKEGPTPGREIIHHAVGIASNATGFPIMLHSYPQAEMGRHQIRILRDENVNLERVKIDHCCETTDIDYLCWIADQGCWLGVDRLPLVSMIGQYAVSTAQRIKTIKKLIDAGLSDRMLFSHDFISFSTFFYYLPNELEKEHIEKINPYRFRFLQEVVFKELEKMGIREDKLIQMCIDNPKRFFEGC